jgi:hypothetical protein
MTSQAQVRIDYPLTEPTQVSGRVQSKADLDSFQALPTDGAIELTGVPLPSGLTNLQLHSVSHTSTDLQVAIDDSVEQRSSTPMLSLWSGKILDEQGSSAFLAFSPFGSRGWVRTSGGELMHLIATPDDQGDWSNSSSYWTTEQELLGLGVRPTFQCEAEQFSDQLPPPPASLPGTFAGGGPLLPYYVCEITVETDYQFYQLFNDLDAAEAYAMALFGAVSDRYREQVGTILHMVYLGLHSDSNDGWSSQDSGGSSGDLLNEFQAAWANGNAPVSADLYHFISGAGLGGGIAYLDVICSQGGGFAVSGNINTNLPFPVAQGPMNWDFVVVAHELGHNFGSPHTHSYCPPLDECAPSFGQCQTQQVCQTDGTLMSYCHLCPGGIANFTTYFHPTVIAVMRDEVENSCLTPFEGVLTQDLGNDLMGSNGLPKLDMDYTDGPDTIDVSITKAPRFQQGFLVGSAATLYLPFQGGVLVPSPDLLSIITASGFGTASFSVPVTLSFPTGAIFYSQVWFLDPMGSGWAASQGLKIELIRP